MCRPFPPSPPFFDRMRAKSSDSARSVRHFFLIIHRFINPKRSYFRYEKHSQTRLSGSCRLPGVDACTARCGSSKISRLRPHGASRPFAVALRFASPPEGSAGTRRESAPRPREQCRNDVLSAHHLARRRFVRLGIAHRLHVHARVELLPSHQRLAARKHVSHALRVAPHLRQLGQGPICAVRGCAFGENLRRPW